MNNPFLKELGKKQLLVPYLNRWFNDGLYPDLIDFSIRLGRKPGPTGGFRASSETTLCSRHLYALKHRDFVPPAFTANARKAFMVGHYYHIMIQWILVEALRFAQWDDIEKEFFLSFEDPKWHARSFTDVAKCNIPDKGEYLIDIKSMRKDEFRLPSLPPEKWSVYTNQVQLYLHWHNMENGMILCCEKDSPHGFKEYEVAYDRLVVEDIYSRWNLVAQALQEEIPPPHDLCVDSDRPCPVEGLYEGVSD